ELDADKLLASPVSEGVQNYVNMCEEIITGDSPFLHLAVEYEMERLSIGFGPEFVAHCERKLGRDILEALSYIRERAAFDYDRTMFNRLQLEMLINERPELAMPLVVAGEAALYAYDTFIYDCLMRAISPIENHIYKPA